MEDPIFVLDLKRATQVKKKGSSMDSIQQITVKAVEEICKTISNIGLENVGKTVKAVFPKAARMTLEIIGTCIAQMDQSLVTAAKAQRRKDGITVKERHVERVLTTELGELRYKRTYFTMPDGSYAYILDHLIGVEAYERFSKELIAEILQAATVNSYQDAIDATKQAISRQTVHNRLVALDELVMPAERMTETPETLDIFVDEDHAHLKPKGQAIVPLVTMTEGIDDSNPKRHKTIHPFHIGAYGAAADAFRENVLAVMTERYDLEQVKQINVHGDGAPWIRSLQQTIPHSRLVLDGYHLEKELRSFLRLEGASHYTKVIRDAMKKEDGYKAFKRYCEMIRSKQTTEKGQEKASKFISYCSDHWDAIVARMSGKTCGSCTEPQVSHVLSDRLSRDPIAWSKEGLNKMTMLVVYSKNGGRVCGEDVRVRVNDDPPSRFNEDGYALYRDYANKQADEVLKVKHDWSIFDHEHFAHGKLNWLYLLRKSFGAQRSIADLIS